MEKKINFTEEWGTGGTEGSEVRAVNRKLADNPIAEIAVKAGTAKFAINAAKGHICVPHRWNVQKEALERCGLGKHVKYKTPLTVRESFAKNIGTKCENTHFIQFEGQTNKENFIASQFKKPDDTDK